MELSDPTKPAKELVLEWCDEQEKRLGQASVCDAIREAFEEMEARIEALEDKLYGKQGVIDAIDRVLAERNVIHASRALGIAEALDEARTKLKTARKRIEVLEDGVCKILDVSKDRERFVMLGPRGWMQAENIARSLLPEENDDGG